MDKIKNNNKKTDPTMNNTVITGTVPSQLEITPFREKPTIEEISINPEDAPLFEGNTHIQEESLVTVVTDTRKSTIDESNTAAAVHGGSITKKFDNMIDHTGDAAEIHHEYQVELYIRVIDLYQLRDHALFCRVSWFLQCCVYVYRAQD